MLDRYLRCSTRVLVLLPVVTVQLVLEVAMRHPCYSTVAYRYLYAIRGYGLRHMLFKFSKEIPSHGSVLKGTSTSSNSTRLDCFTRSQSRQKVLHENINY
jgi:hypothetical protein